MQKRTFFKNGKQTSIPLSNKKLVKMIFNVSNLFDERISTFFPLIIGPPACKSDFQFCSCE